MVEVNWYVWPADSDAAVGATLMTAAFPATSAMKTRPNRNVLSFST